jgi:hypothetical protein
MINFTKNYSNVWSRMLPVSNKSENSKYKTNGNQMLLRYQNLVSKQDLIDYLCFTSKLGINSHICSNLWN